MFSLAPVSPPTLIAISAGLCIAFTLCALCLAAGRLPPRQIRDESWRDDVPWLRTLRPILQRFAPVADKRLNVKQRTSLQNRIGAAGLNYVITPPELTVVRWLCAIGALLIVAFLAWRYQLWLSPYMPLLLLLPPLGYAYADIWLRDSAKVRTHRIERDFPFFLDVLVLSMRAGLAFPAALRQATLQLPAGPMRQELSRLDREVRTGADRTHALFAMAQRIRLASISNFVAVVAQSEESGGSITNALMEQARQRRRERFARAEKLANQAPVKLLFPLVAFLFPVTFIILGFPIVRDVSSSGLFGG